MTVDANRVSDERLAEHFEVGRSAWSAIRSLTSDEIFSVVAELQSLRRSPSLSGGEVNALRDIAAATDPDDPESYRNDDREGCLDTVHAIASEALSTLNGAKP